MLVELSCLNIIRQFCLISIGLYYNYAFPEARSMRWMLAGLEIQDYRDGAAAHKSRFLKNITYYFFLICLLLKYIVCFFCLFWWLHIYAIDFSWTQKNLFEITSTTQVSKSQVIYHYSFTHSRYVYHQAALTSSFVILGLMIW